MEWQKLRVLGMHWPLLNKKIIEYFLTPPRSWCCCWSACWENLQASKNITFCMRLQTFLTTFHIHINSEFFGFNFNPDSDSPFLYPFHRAHAQCSLGIHHGVQQIELHRYVLCCCLSLFSNEYFRGIEMKLVLISEISLSFIYSVPEKNIMHLVVQVRPTWHQVVQKLWHAKIQDV